MSSKAEVRKVLSQYLSRHGKITRHFADASTVLTGDFDCHFRSIDLGVELFFTTRVLPPGSRSATWEGLISLGKGQGLMLHVVIATSYFRKLIIVHFKQYRKNRHPGEQGDEAEKKVGTGETRWECCEKNGVKPCRGELSILTLSDCISIVVKY